MMSVQVAAPAAAAAAAFIVAPLVVVAPAVVARAAAGTTWSSAAFPYLVGSRRGAGLSHSSVAIRRLGGSLSPSSSSSSRGEASMRRSWLSKLGFGGGGSNRSAQADAYNGPGIGPDDDKPAAGEQFAVFGGGCFWGVELAFQRVPGVTKTESGYTQGFLHNPSYRDVCDGDTGHSEVVRVQFDPARCSYEHLLDVFWAGHDPTTLNRQGGDVGTQYRSGIYFYSPEQEKIARESMEGQQSKLSKKIFTEILPAKKFYRAEEYHQQYLAKGGRFGFRQSADKGCKDPIRCYG